MGSRRLLTALVIAIAVVAAACTGTSSDEVTTTTGGPTTTVELPELEFGRGVMPASVPLSWPMPDQSVIGATMIDGTRGLTEVVATYPASVPAVVNYYTQNLPVLGYEVTNSKGTDAEWRLEFSGEGLSGEVLLKGVGSGLTTGTLRFIRG